jgi:hypothetical protein
MSTPPPNTRCFRAIEVYCIGVRALARIVLWWIAQGGFCLYAYFAVCHLIAPYFAIVSGLGLHDPLVITASLLTIIVFYPYFELLIILPLGIFREMANFRQLWRLSPLHWALKALDYVIHILRERTAVAVLLIFFVSTGVIGLTATLIVYMAVDTPWSATTIMVFTLPPVLFAIYNIVRLVSLSWLSLC